MKIKTDSIKGKLDIALISVLVVILVVPLALMGILGLYGFVLSPEAYAEIIAAVATLLAIVLTLGLRLIDDTLNRYEKFAQPKIISLGSFLERNSAVSVKNDLETYYMFTLQGIIQNLTDSASALKKHGQFLFTTLYPKQLVTKTLEICGELKKLLALIEEVKPYWTEPMHFEVFLEGLILGRIDYNKKHSPDVFNEGFHAISKRAIEASLKAESEKPTVASQIRTLREKILQEIKTVTEGLDSFLEAN